VFPLLGKYNTRKEEKRQRENKYLKFKRGIMVGEASGPKELFAID